MTIGIPPNGGRRGAGGNIGGLLAGGGSGPANIGGLRGNIGIETGDLDSLHKKLDVIVKDITKLDDAVDKLTKSLTSAGQAFVSAISPLGPGGMKPSTVSAAPVSAFGGASRSLAFGAAGEIGAQWAGGINTMMNNLTVGNMSTDLMARQANVIFGNNGPGMAGRTVAGYGQINAMSPTDLATAVSGYQSNPFLFTRPGSRNARNLSQFSNTVTAMNPSLGAAGAASFANTLASAPMMNLLNRFGLSNNGALVRPSTGSNPNGINNPNQVFSALSRLVTGGQRLTSAQMSAFASSANSGQWALANQNMAAYGINPQEMNLIRQYMAAGGNLNRAVPGGAVAGSALGRAAAGTRTGLAAFEATSGVQNTMNALAMNASSIVGDFVRLDPTLVAFTASLALATKYLLAIGAKGAEAAALGTGLGGLGGGGAAGGVAAEGEAALTTTAAAEGGVLAKLGIGRGAGGLLSKLGGSGLLRTLGKGFGLQLGGSILGGLVGGNGTGVRGALGHGISDAGLGAMIGSIFPGVGTALGAGVGGAFGLGSSLFHDFLGDPTGSTNTSGMSPAMAHRTSAMMAANPNLRITSGHRTAQQQATLYAMKGGRGVAPPGQSMHQTGQAADMGPPSQFGWIARNAKRFGLHTPSRAEPWHVQAMGDPTITSEQWASGYINQLPGASKATGPSDPRVKFIQAIMQEEGTFSIGNENNPLDVEGSIYGGYSGFWNSAGVTKYSTRQAGYQATNKFMAQQNDAAMYRLLKSPSSTIAQLVASSVNSAWSGAAGAIAQDARVPLNLTASGGGGGGGSGTTVVSPPAPSGKKSSKTASTSTQADSLLAAYTKGLSATTLSNSFLNDASGITSARSTSGIGIGFQPNREVSTAMRYLGSDKNSQLAMMLGAILDSGSRVASDDAKNMASSYGIGDYMGDPVVSGTGIMRRPAVSGSVIHTHPLSGSRITLHMPIQVVRATEQDAERLAQMVLAKLRDELGFASMSGK